MILRLLTDAQARERFPADYEDVKPGLDAGAGALGAGVYDRLAELARVLPEHGEVIVCRDWEGCVFAEVKGGLHLGLDGLALTTTGAIGHGGVNMPVYFDSLAALLAHDAQRAHARLAAQR